MSDREFAAPAKLNLFLHVVGRRPDGYHLLQTAFRLLDHGDTLSFELNEDGEIARSYVLADVAERDDLCLRAARLLKAVSGVRAGVTIGLNKRLPSGGGLGGGSSDAATTLLALNRLWKLEWPRGRLQELGLRLGADVPFFVFGHNAFAEGVGELLHPIDLPPAWYLVIEPAVSVSTAEIFASRELTRNTKRIKLSDFSAGWVWQSAANDLQPVVCKRYPQVAAALQWLDQFGIARMSGSGSCVFAEFAEEGRARAVLAQLPAGWRGWVARAMDRHPLWEFAA